MPRHRPRSSPRDRPKPVVDHWRWFNGRTQSVLAATAVLAVLIAAHVPLVNGPWYFPWPWRRLPAEDIFPPLAIGFVLFVVAQRIHDRGKMHVSVALAALMLAMLAMASLAVSVQSTPFGLDRFSRIISSPIATAYYADAVRLSAVERWLAQFHLLSPQLYAHSMTKPPGPILVASAFVRWTDAPALMLGLAITAVSALSIPATYVMSRVLGADKQAAFASASLMALSPGLVLFCPEFDQVYPILSCGMIVSWVASLERQRLAYAALFGVFLAVATFMAYNLLVLGALLALYSLAWLLRAQGRHAVRLVVHVIAALAVVLMAYSALWLTTRYDPVATFRAALANQARLLEVVQRPYPATILFDLWDFALGVGWLPVGLAAATLASRMRRGWTSDRTTWAVVLVALQLAIVAVTALLPGETARVWIFMMPLMAFAAGLELAEWRLAERMVVYASMWLLLAVICQNMTFIAV